MARVKAHRFVAVFRLPGIDASFDREILRDAPRP
jgi:hypothetical protein